MQDFFLFWLRMAADKKIRVAILSCAILANQPISAPNCVVGMFEAFLQAGLDKMKHDYRFSDTNIAFDRYNCVAGQLPNLFADLDAIIITGSAASVRDCDTWILHLKKFIYGKLFLHSGALSSRATQQSSIFFGQRSSCLELASDTKFSPRSYCGMSGQLWKKTLKAGKQEYIA